MPFTKLPLSPGGGLEATHPPSRISTKHSVRFAVTDPIRLQVSHTTSAIVKLAVEFLESPYPPIEIQCPPQYRAFMSPGVS